MIYGKKNPKVLSLVSLALVRSSLVNYHHGCRFFEDEVVDIVLSEETHIKPDDWCLGLIQLKANQNGVGK